MMKRTQAREITTLAYFYTSASPRAVESEGIEASWPNVIPMEKSGIADWTRYNCLLRNSLNR